MSHTFPDRSVKQDFHDDAKALKADQPRKREGAESISPRLPPRWEVRLPTRTGTLPQTLIMTDALARWIQEL